MSELIEALRRGEGLAAWRQIADALEGEIAAGQLAQGAQLPTEAALAVRFAVNRHTVRRALAALAERGLVRASQGRGTFVEVPPLAYPIGRRTRFSEIVTGAGREPWGDLISQSEGAASPEVAAMLAVPEGAPLLELVTVHRADGVPLSTARTWLPLPRFAGFAGAYETSGSITRPYGSTSRPGERSSWSPASTSMAKASPCRPTAPSSPPTGWNSWWAASPFSGSVGSPPFRCRLSVFVSEAKQSRAAGPLRMVRIPGSLRSQ